MIPSIINLRFLLMAPCVDHIISFAQTILTKFHILARHQDFIIILGGKKHEGNQFENMDGMGN